MFARDYRGSASLSSMGRGPRRLGSALVAVVVRDRETEPKARHKSEDHQVNRPPTYHLKSSRGISSGP